MFEPNTELLEWFADGMPIDCDRCDDLDGEEDGDPAARPDALPAAAREGVPARGCEERAAA